MASNASFGWAGRAPGTAPHPARRAFDVAPAPPTSPSDPFSRLEGMVADLHLGGAANRAPAATGTPHSRTPIQSTFSATRPSRSTSATGRPASAKSGSPDHLRRRQGARVLGSPYSTCLSTATHSLLTNPLARLHSAHHAAMAPNTYANASSPSGRPTTSNVASHPRSRSRSNQASNKKRGGHVGGGGGSTRSGSRGRDRRDPAVARSGRDPAVARMLERRMEQQQQLQQQQQVLRTSSYIRRVL